MCNRYGITLQDEYREAGECTRSAFRLLLDSTKHFVTITGLLATAFAFVASGNLEDSGDPRSVSEQHATEQSGTPSPATVPAETNGQASTEKTKQYDSNEEAKNKQAKEGLDSRLMCSAISGLGILSCLAFGVAHHRICKYNRWFAERAAQIEAISYSTLRYGSDLDAAESTGRAPSSTLPLYLRTYEMELEGHTEEMEVTHGQIRSQPNQEGSGKQPGALKELWRFIISSKPNNYYIPLICILFTGVLWMAILLWKAIPFIWGKLSSS